MSQSLGILMTMGHTVFEDATRPLITLKIGHSVMIQQKLKNKTKKKEKKEYTAIIRIMRKVRRIKGHPHSKKVWLKSKALEAGVSGFKS